MNTPLAQAKCFKHVSREAAAKCPACGRFYCRECVTEHEGRVVCRTCLDTLLQQQVRARPGWLQASAGWGLALAGYLIIFYGFYLLGRMLLRIPSTFHSGIFFD